MAGMYPDNRVVDLYDEEVNWPGVDENGKYTNGNFSDPSKKPSFLDANTLNLILDNIGEFIKATGRDPNNTDIDQLKNLLSQDAMAEKIAQYDGGGRIQGNAPVDDKDLVNKQYMLDLLLPVGFIYTQYPGGKTPSTMNWPGTWAAQFDSEGIFFRTPGSRANSFEQYPTSRGIQQDAFQKHRVMLPGAHLNHSHGVTVGYHQHKIPRTTNSSTGSGGLANWGNRNSWVDSDWAKSTVSIHTRTFGDKHSEISESDSYGSPRTDYETRPKNRTIRVWKRTR